MFCILKSFLTIFFQCEAKKMDDCNTYLKLPSLKSSEMAKQSKKSVHSGGLAFSKTDSFKINFQLCSTKLAQNGI